MEIQPIRTVQPSVPAQGTTVSTSERTPQPVESHDVEPGISVYEEVKGYPYAQEAFGLEHFLQDKSYGDVRGEMHEVEEFVQSQIKAKNLQNTTEAYREILAQLNKEIGEYANERPFEYFKRVASAVKAINRLKAAHIQPVLSPDVLSIPEFEAIKGIVRG